MYFALVLSHCVIAQKFWLRKSQKSHLSTVSEPSAEPLLHGGLQNSEWRENALLEPF